ncbi:MAG: DNA methyltransferase [Pseudomonadota bacterium]
MTATSFLDGKVVLHPGDCLEVLAQLDENSVDTVITDPPYHFQTIVQRFGKEGSAAAKQPANGTGVYARASAGFMGKEWDGGDIAFRPETWAAVMRVLKPGGHLAAFSAPKCVHKMAMAIELAGFEVRDRIVNLIDPDPRMAAFLESLSPAQADALFRLLDQFGPLGEAFWTFGTGFPKNQNISKAIDKLRLNSLTAGADAPPARARPDRSATSSVADTDSLEGSSRIDPDRSHVERSEAQDLAHKWNGWGDALKPAYEPIVIARKPVAERSVARQVLKTGTGAINVGGCAVGDEVLPSQTAGEARLGTFERKNMVTPERMGRFPANLTHDGSDAAVAGFPNSNGQHGEVTGAEPSSKFSRTVYGKIGRKASGPPRGDFGSASRFFYCGKADASDRLGSKHPTVKPQQLMRWLVKMLTPPGGTILDPFAGTGSTGEAAYREGFKAILIEREAEYQADIANRMKLATAGRTFRKMAASKTKEPPPLPMFEDLAFPSRQTPEASAAGARANIPSRSCATPDDDTCDRDRRPDGSSPSGSDAAGYEPDPEHQK